MATPDDVLPIGTIIDERYELVREIGRGGCAVVYEANDHRLRRMVAIKLPLGAPPGTAAEQQAAVTSRKTSRFTRESRVIASIHHPNVCAVLDTGVLPDGTPFLVMERLFGESLRSSITRSGRLGLHEAIAVALQLLSGLGAVHQAGIVHRDIKPDNLILVTRYGCDPIVKLLDFGLCRRSDSRTPVQEETMTREGAIVGTPEYMSPEQVLGCTSLDVRVDIYAVGVLLYETLTGDRIFFARSVREILSAVMSKKIAPLRYRRPDAPASLEHVIRRAMDRNPARRYQSATEFQEALHAVKAELNALARAQRRPAADGWELPTTRYQRPESASRIAKMRAGTLPPGATGTDG